MNQDDFHPANKSLVKDMNTASILRLVRTKGPISRAELSKLTGLNPATVSSNVAGLLEADLVRETGIGASSGGRKPVLIELNQDAYYVIGVDMGTTDVSAGVADLEGKIRHKVRLPFGEQRSLEAILGVIRQAIREAMAAAPRGPERCMGIGMGVHGLVDPEQGISLYAPAFQWRNVPIAERFSREFGLPVTIENDARAMALGEKWFGRAAAVGNFVFLNIGTGIGSGIYVNGELIRGAHYGAGEIGHIRVREDGEACFCGKRGCLSTLSAGPALEYRARKAAAQGEAPLLLERANQQPERITGPMIHEAAIAGDPYSVRLLDEAGRSIGSALSVLVNLLNPDMILIGGGVSNAGAFLFESIRDEVRQRSMDNNTEKLYIGPAGLGDDCGMIGAAALILRSVYQNPNQYNS